MDDVHLCCSPTLNALRDLSEYNFAIFFDARKLNIYQTSKCQFTFGTKSNFNTFGKSLRIWIE